MTQSRHAKMMARFADNKKALEALLQQQQAYPVREMLFALQDRIDALEAQRRPFDILTITTAYEQGVGKGHQAHGRGVEIENPYAPGECRQAWELGYDEGKKQASPKVPHNIKESLK